MAKYVLPGVPAGAQLSAFMPSWTKYAASGALQYKATVNGQPGTQGIPAPTRDTVPQPDLGDIANMGTSRSSDAPDVWYPQIYFQRTLDSAPGFVVPVQVYSDNLVPVPAVDIRGRVKQLVKPVNQRGQKMIVQPRVVPKWS